MNENYDAILLMSFGGPEGMDDVMPYLDNVLRGKNVPEERKLEVSHHYEQFGGVSPINEQNRELIKALKKELAENNISLPVYWGNRNWDPYIEDTMHEMKAAGHKRVLAFFTSAYSSYSGCRQYREDIQRAREAVGDDAPVVDKVRIFFNHPGFIEAEYARIQEALSSFEKNEKEQVFFLFTAHSIPMSMASGCNYEAQLKEVARLLSDKLGNPPSRLVYQSRSGPPHQPWLEPDVCDVIEELAGEGVKNLVIAPIGFLSDHLEVLFDLDTEAMEACEEAGIKMARAGTVGIHPSFVSMIVDLITERIEGREEKKVVGNMPAEPDVCREGCCKMGSGHPGK